MQAVPPGITPALITPEAATLGVLAFLAVLAAGLAGPVVQAIFEGRSRCTSAELPLDSTSQNQRPCEASARRAA
jgi:hypothetical protein